MSASATRRQQGQRVNTLIDQALLAPSADHQQQLVQLTQTLPVTPLADRLRKRATWICKRRREDTRQLLATRDALIMALYAAMVPTGWACGWCDGSSIKQDATYQAGIGGIVMVSQGPVIVRISRAIGDRQAFEAEVAAVVAVIRAALDQQQRRLWVYTDNSGLARLWQTHREDDRLAELRQLSVQLDRFALQALPRRHNQPANALAKAAATEQN